MASAHECSPRLHSVESHYSRSLNERTQIKISNDVNYLQECGWYYSASIHLHLLSLYKVYLPSVVNTIFNQHKSKHVSMDCQKWPLQGGPLLILRPRGATQSHQPLICANRLDILYRHVGGLGIPRKMGGKRWPIWYISGKTDM